MSTDTGGPAFPGDYFSAGMTLRDYFAAKAHQAVIADSFAYSSDVDLSEFLAKLAYRHADAMLKARQSGAERQAGPRGCCKTTVAP